RPPELRGGRPMLSIQIGARPRQLVGAVLVRLGRQDLVQVDPVVAETIGATGQVHPPDAQGALGDQPPGFVQVGFQAPAPEIQRARVMQAQALHVYDFQARFADAGADLHQMRQLAVGEYVAADELASAVAHRPAIDMPRRDAVVYQQINGAHYFRELPAVLQQFGLADVLEHADADHLVELAVPGQVAVVHQLQLHLPLQTLGSHAFATELDLLTAEGDA